MARNSTYKNDILYEKSTLLQSTTGDGEKQQQSLDNDYSTSTCEVFVSYGSVFTHC